MVELFVLAMEKLIDLLKRREELDGAFYDDFIAPAFAVFEAVHRDYLESFRRYHDLFQDERYPIDRSHPVLAAILTDNLFSEDIRAKLWNAGAVEIRTELHPASTLFVHAIQIYLLDLIDGLEGEGSYAYRLDGADALRQGESLFNQRVRTGLSTELWDAVRMEGTDQERRREANRLLNERIARLQRGFQQVAEAHSRLKTELLAPL